MSGTFLSEMWYRVAELQPRLHPHISIFRQRFRGQSWYVLQDRSSGRVHRFSPATYALINGMDGANTVDMIWGELAEQLGDAAPSQDDVIQLLHRLHAADVLQSGSPPEIKDMVSRKRRHARSVLLRNLLNPVALRLPLWDPDKFLEWSWPAVRPFVSVAGAMVWLFLIGLAALLAAQHWRDLSENMTDRLLGMQNLFALWLTYPAVKILHEFAHGYAVKNGGGEVHEMGVMFLVFAPAPYIDASISAGFRSKWQRMAVAAAGIVMDLLLAAIAMFVWLSVEPGAIRAMAYNVMLICGVSTLLFNGNPLLRFDGYYVLSDFLEIPNLAQRSNQYLSYLVKRKLFGNSSAESPGHTRGETFWLLVYAPIAWIYRLIVMVAIALVVASKYFFAGVVLALWSVFMALIWPIVKGIHYVIGHPEIDRQRGRAASITFGAIATVLLLGSYAPLPSWTIAEGVVWLPANAEVRTGTSGFVSRIVARPGAYVKAGAPLLELSDDEAAAEVQVHLAKKQQLAVQLGSEMFDNRLKAELTKQSLESEMAILARLDAKQDELVCFAGRAGNWTLLNGEDALGRYLAQGALVGYVLSDNARTVRVVVAQDDVDQVRVHAKRISLRPVDRPWLTISAKSAREVPGGSERLPSKALSLDGGGRIATDPRDSSGLKTLGRTFQFDLELDGDASDLVFGSRVYVRFDHDDLPLFVQIYRAVRQVILAKLAF